MSLNGVVIAAEKPKRTKAKPVADEIDKLAAVFMQGDETMPQYLAESVHIIDEMADAAGMEAILEAAEQFGLALELGDMPTPADVAVQAWLKNPQLLEHLHNRQRMNRARSLVHFACAPDRVPELREPEQERVDAMAVELGAWFGARKRGHACQVSMYPKVNECCFVVRHGEPCKREGAVKNGKSETVFYRPQSHDVVIYSKVTGELRMKAASLSQMRLYREAFGGSCLAMSNFSRVNSVTRWRRFIAGGSAWPAAILRGWSM